VSFRVLDLFAGIGGFHLAAKPHGGEVVLACEINRQARETYARNFPGTPLHDDVKTLTDPPDHDMLCGGFPCQPFSTASDKSSDKVRRGFDDARGTVFFDIVRILDQKKPAMFLLENVYGLRSHDNGRSFKVVVSALEELGYSPRMLFMSSKPWVAQDRKRIFFVGFREPTFFSRDMIRVPLKPWPVPRDVLLDEPGPEAYPSAKQQAYLAWVRARNDEFVARGERKSWPQIVIEPDRPVRTIRADPSSTLHTHTIPIGPDLYRRISCREAARFMGFPDDFKLHPEPRWAYQQMGNAVVPPMASAIIEAMLAARA